MPNKKAPLHVTVSIGMAIDDGTSASVDDIIKQADVALYRAKHEGRDRVVAADDRRLVAISR